MKGKILCIWLTALTVSVISLPVNVAAAPLIDFVGLPAEAIVGKFDEISVEVEAADEPVTSVELYINDVKHPGEPDINGSVYTFTNFENNAGEMKITAIAYDAAGEYAQITEFVRMSMNINLPVVPLNNMETSITPNGFTTNYQGYSAAQADVPKNNGDPNKALRILRPAGITAEDPPLFELNIPAPRTVLQGIRFDVYIPSGTSGGTYFTLLTNRGATTLNALTCRKLNGQLIMNSVSFNNTFQTDRWHECRYEVDPLAKTYWFYVDGSMITPEAGYKYTSGAEMTVFKMQTYLPNEGDYICYDNIATYRMSSQKVESVTASGPDTISMVMYSDFAGKDSSFELYLGNSIVPSVFDYNTSSKTINIRSVKPLISSLEYKIVGRGLKTPEPEGIPLNCDIVQYVKSPSRDFDVLNVRFTGSLTKTGAKATVQNLGDTEESIVMVMVFKNADGAVEGVYSSEIVSLPSKAIREVSISPVENENMKAEVFFLKNWSGSKCAKSHIYKQ